MFEAFGEQTSRELVRIPDNEAILSSTPRHNRVSSRVLNHIICLCKKWRWPHFMQSLHWLRWWTSCCLFHFLPIHYYQVFMWRIWLRKWSSRLSKWLVSECLREWGVLILRDDLDFRKFLKRMECSGEEWAAVEVSDTFVSSCQLVFTLSGRCWATQCEYLGFASNPCLQFQSQPDF